AVQACALAPGAESFKPAQDGAWSDAPKYDCAKPVPGTVDGSNVTFDVASLAAAGRVAVAIVPTMPTDRVAFAKPTDSSLATTPASSDAGTRLAAPTNAASTSSDGAARAGRILTMGLLLLALLAYSRGYGLLGGRVADR